MLFIRTGSAVTFEYRNHRGETAQRRGVVRSFDYGSNEWYPEDQWFMHCWDGDRQADRSFALANITPGSLKVNAHGND